MFKLELFRSIQYVYKQSKLYFFTLVLLRLGQGFIPLITLIVTKKLLNLIQDYFITGSVPMQTIIFCLCVQVSIMVVNEILQRGSALVELVLAQKMEYNLKKLLVEKLSKIQYIHYENHDFLNHLERVQGDMGTRFLNPVLRILDLGKNTVSLITIFGFLIHIHWALIFISILTAIPVFIMQSKFGEEKYFLMRYQTPRAREQHYLFSLFMARETNKEIRLYQAKDFLLKKWSTTFLKNNKEILKQSISQHKKTILLKIGTSLIYSGSVLILLWLIVNKRIKIGDFVATIEAIQHSQSVISDISYLLADLYQQRLYIRDLYALFEYPEDEATASVTFPKLEGKIEFKELSFSYPFVKKNSLQNINIEIFSGETVVIVGENGSGKTTLVKCLVGLFKSNNGKILFDGININEIDKHSLHSNISIVFQDFTKYEFNVLENITLRNPETTNNYKVEQVVKQSGAYEFITKLKNHYNTRLGRMFEDSVDLSGGQWQRIALARSLMKDSQILILDEPTSALDPIAEAELFKRFKEITEGRTAIYISHRMYACHLADKIIVMKNGQIAEVGNHEELISKEGEYARLYTLQADMYDKNTYVNEVV